MQNNENENIQLISQGAYGCIFRPGINCIGNIDKNTSYITKIQSNIESIQNELDTGKHLYLKNPSAFFRYAVVESSCPVSFGQIKEESIEKCNVLNTNPSDVFFSNKIRYVGKFTLKKYLYFLFEKPNKKLFWVAFFQTQVHLLGSLQNLLEKKVLHKDIKHNNVMIDDRSSFPVIIDFGLSFRIDLLVNTSDYYQKFSLFDDYFPWCLELQLVSFIISNSKVVSFSGGKDTSGLENDEDEDDGYVLPEKKSFSVKMKKDSQYSENVNLWATSIVNINHLIEIIDHYFKENRVLNEIYSEPYKNIQKRKWKKWIRKTCTGKKGKEVVEFLMEFWETWDTYSFSVMYFLMIRELLPTELLEYHSILISNILALPFKRKKPLVLLKEIQSFLLNLKLS